MGNSICVRCGHLHRYDDNLDLVEPDPAALAALDARTRRTIRLAQLAIARGRGSFTGNGSPADGR